MNIIFHLGFFQNFQKQDLMLMRLIQRNIVENLVPFYKLNLHIHPEKEAWQMGCIKFLIHIQLFI